VVSYVEQGPGFWRRLRRRLFSAPVVIPVVFIGAAVLGVLIYYWTVFSGRIDNLLAGEVFTRSAGIYAAPKQLRVEETISQADLIGFLKRAGYVEKTQQADTSRGRYTVSGTTVEIEPSSASSVDGRQQFLHVRVQFNGSGKAINSLYDLDNRSSIERTWLEPELISSVTGTERAKRKVIGFGD
jgi:penicillin-binding protein 1B